MAKPSLRDSILEFLCQQSHQGANRSMLARQLGIHPNLRQKLRKVLNQLVDEGIIVQGRKSAYRMVTTDESSDEGSLVGTIKFHPKGHAFFYPDHTEKGNIATGIDLVELDRVQISRHDTQTALDGDRVRMEIKKAHPRRQRHARHREPDVSEITRGVVTKVLERRSGRVVGTYHKKKGFGWVECDDKAIGGSIEICGDTTASSGQLVVVDLSNWQKSQDPRGRIIEVLGWPGDQGVDMAGVIQRYGLATTFPKDVIAEARAVPEEPDAGEIQRREDWRERLVITIDPADAKDHDDAIWVERNKSGWTLGVHIADVSHYIKPGSPMDREAARRGNSTYLVDRVLPMLPVELSNGICSLKPDVDRLTKCALIKIDFKGKVVSAQFSDAVIHSRAKISYEQAQTILNGGPAPKASDKKLAPMVREAWKMASAMRRRRFENGALDMEMPETKIRLDDEGRTETIEPVEHTESHQLIEECMLIANEAVAKILREQRRPSIYRVHDDPDPSRLMDYAEVARQHGYRVGDLTNRDHVQQLINSAKGRPEEHIIKLGLLKSLKRAAYSADPLGHYGLAKADYCHFTSPIRRYADLIVHRALQPFLTNRRKDIDKTQSYTRLIETARRISDTERASSDAESESKQLKLYEYLQRIIDERKGIEFKGLVTEVRPMGLMVEVPSLGLRGVVKREDLPGHNRWWLEGHRGAWVTTGDRQIHIGMRVPLIVVAIDLERRFVDFAVAGDVPKSERPPRQKASMATPMRKHKGKHQAYNQVKSGHHKTLQKRRGQQSKKRNSSSRRRRK